MSGTTWLRLGAILGGLAVAAGAFGAHALEKALPPSIEATEYPTLTVMAKSDTDRRLATFETGARYQMYHALGLVAVGLLAKGGERRRALDTAGWSFLVGIVLFSGSLYALALTRIRWLGAITPIGGVLFLVGWAALAAHRPEKAARDSEI